MDKTKQSQLVEAFADAFIDGKRFENIISARNFAESILNQKVAPGTVAAKVVDEAVEQGVVRAARSLVLLGDSVQSWEQCLDLHSSQPGLNTRTSTSILQQAYSTPIPIAFLASQLAGISKETTVYEPAAGNGALLLTADPNKAIANELNPDRAAALRSQGFTVTEQDASIFLPQIEPVDRVITNPPFGSLKDAQGQTKMFQRGLLTTSQLDHAIALKALDLMKPDGRAVLILGGKIGEERSRQERYNTQLTRGFYRWLYKDAGYKVSDHFSLAGSLYRKQGTTFPIDVIVIEGRGETQLKLPGVQPPRIYESYETLKEVLINAIQQQQIAQPKRDYGVALRRVYTGTALDTNIPDRNGTPPTVDYSASPRVFDSDRRQGGVLFPSDTASGVADRTNNRVSLGDIRDSTGERCGVLGSGGDQSIFADVHEQPIAPAKSSGDGRVLGEQLPGTTAAMFPNGGDPIPSHPPFDNGGELELPGRYESDGLVDVDELGRQSAQFPRLNAMPDSKLEASEQKATLSNQISYRPRSQAFSLNTLIPTAALKGLENAFNKIEATTGMNLDEYVGDRLNETSQQTLFQHYAAEQIDSLALAIYNYEYEQKATLIGHDTGIGKTRIVCGLARYAKDNGMVPIIVTADAVLYADILSRDAIDTGNYFNPLITNNEMKVTLTSSNGEKIGEINTPKNQIEKVREYAISGNLGEHDCVFTIAFPNLMRYSSSSE